MSDNGIDEALALMGKKTLGSKREIKALPDQLNPGERVDRMASGFYGGATGLLVLTNQRLLFLKDGWTSKKTEDFPLDKVTSVQWKSGMVMGSATIMVAGNSAEIEKMDKANGQALVDAARARLNAPSAPAGGGDAAERLHKLKGLHEAGILSDEEYEAKRTEILSDL